MLHVMKGETASFAVSPRPLKLKFILKHLTPCVLLRLIINKRKRKTCEGLPLLYRLDSFVLSRFVHAR